MKAIVKSYDTWGNAKDGFDVNNVFTQLTETVATADMATAQQLMHQVWHKRGEYPATENVMSAGLLRIEDLGTEVFNVYRGPMPIGEIEFVEEE